MPDIFSKCLEKGEVLWVVGVVCFMHENPKLKQVWKQRPLPNIKFDPKASGKTLFSRSGLSV